jgi:thiamine pyrophosphate-dependent acetolactate synthase large subunit-like protein
MPTGAEQLVAALEAAEVDVVFGLPGVHNLAAWEALRASDRIRLIGVRHEQTAGYAADGYARATGRVGVALVTTGPGAANVVTATGEAHASGTPLVVVATDIPSELRREGVVRGVLHETIDQHALFAPVTKAQLTARPGDDLGALLGRATQIASTPPRRPVYVGIPTDLLTREGGTSKPRGRAPGIARTRGVPEARKLLASAERPLVLAGGGARHAGAEVGAFAERLGAPLLTTFGAAGLHPSAIAPLHDPGVGALWDRADVVVGVGTDLDGVDTQNWAMPRPPTLIQVNVDPDDAAKNWEPDHVVVGDAAVVADIAIEKEPWFERPQVEVEDPQAAQLIAALDEALPPDAAVVCDMCIPGYWIGGYRPTEGLQYPIGWGTLGFGFPAALGAALSGRPTVAIVGDGGFLFACGELAAIEQERLPLTVLVFDDGGYGMLRHGGDPFRLHTPDFVALAHAFGVHAAACALEDLAPRLADHVLDPAPSLIAIKTEMTPPPTTSPRWYRVRR